MLSIHTTSAVSQYISESSVVSLQHDHGADRYAHLLSQLTHALEREQAMQERIQQQAEKLQQLKAQLHRRQTGAGDSGILSSAPAELETVRFLTSERFYLRLAVGKVLKIRERW
jgi:L-lactate utilization protein LutC